MGFGIGLQCTCQFLQNLCLYEKEISVFSRIVVRGFVFFGFRISKNLEKANGCHNVYFKKLHSYEILGAGMLWKPKEAQILTNFIDQPVNIQ
jgi:hypothetical protein